MSEYTINFCTESGLLDDFVYVSIDMLGVEIGADTIAFLPIGDSRTDSEQGMIPAGRPGYVPQAIARSRYCKQL